MQTTSLTSTTYLHHHQHQHHQQFCASSRKGNFSLMNDQDDQAEDDDSGEQEPQPTTDFNTNGFQSRAYGCANPEAYQHQEIATEQFAPSYHHQTQTVLQQALSGASEGQHYLQSQHTDFSKGPGLLDQSGGACHGAMVPAEHHQLQTSRLTFEASASSSSGVVYAASQAIDLSHQEAHDASIHQQSFGEAAQTGEHGQLIGSSHKSTPSHATQQTPAVYYTMTAPVQEAAENDNLSHQNSSHQDEQCLLSHENYNNHLTNHQPIQYTYLTNSMIDQTTRNHHLIHSYQSAQQRQPPTLNQTTDDYTAYSQAAFTTTAPQLQLEHQHHYAADEHQHSHQLENIPPTHLNHHHLDGLQRDDGSGVQYCMDYQQEQSVRENHHYQLEEYHRMLSQSCDQSEQDVQQHNHHSQNTYQLMGAGPDSHQQQVVAHSVDDMTLIGNNGQSRGVEEEEEEKADTHQGNEDSQAVVVVPNSRGRTKKQSSLTSFVSTISCSSTSSSSSGGSSESHSMSAYQSEELLLDSDLESVDSQLTRDEKRAREANIPLSYQEIVNLSIDQFNDHIVRFPFTEAQLTLMKDIRRRGKNKVAAQTCRKRKMEQISELQLEVTQLANKRMRLSCERSRLSQEHSRLANEYERLYASIQSHLQVVVVAATTTTTTSVGNEVASTLAPAMATTTATFMPTTPTTTGNLIIHEPNLIANVS